MSQRIGLLPGSFNPPHFGHVELALKAMRAANLDWCFFYVNSINRQKQGELAPPTHRRHLLNLMLVDPNMSVLDAEFFPDNPGQACLPQEEVFVALMEKILATASQPAQFWLARGSDNFRSLEESGYLYPPELGALPHVIGLRGERDRDYDYSAVREKIFVQTRPISSTEVRRGLRRGGGVAHLIGPSAERFIEAQRLFSAIGAQ
jgi:nicotinic acid mononucleotide adenylyltransferase